MIASMWIGNLMLLVINLPLIGVWVKFLDVPYRLMYRRSWSSRASGSIR